MCKVNTGYCGTSEIEHGLCACTVDNPVAKARGLSLRTGAQTMLYLSLIACVHGLQQYGHLNNNCPGSSFLFCSVCFEFVCVLPSFLYLGVGCGI